METKYNLSPITLIVGAEIPVDDILKNFLNAELPGASTLFGGWISQRQEHIYKDDRYKVIIINESIGSLHPKMQLTMLEEMLDHTKAGYNLIIHTTSDFIVRDLNNKILAGSLVRNGCLLDNEMSNVINSDNITCYEYSKDLDSLTRIPVAMDGFCITSIDKVITNQNDLADSLLDIYYKHDLKFIRTSTTQQ